MKLNRRDILAFALFSPLLLYAKPKDISYAKRVTLLQEPYQSISLLHTDLFYATRFFKILNNINTIAYLKGVLNDRYVSQKEKEFIQSGVTWLHERSQAEFGAKYYQLDFAGRQKVLELITHEYWGERWVSTIMTYFFEAVFCDPIYGGNEDFIGSKALGFINGVPRPKTVLYRG